MGSARSSNRGPVPIPVPDASIRVKLAGDSNRDSPARGDCQWAPSPPRFAEIGDGERAQSPIFADVGARDPGPDSHWVVRACALPVTVLIVNG
jgi:hypothetical protein